MLNGGDVLARGGHRAQFQPAKVSQDKWDSIFADYTPEVEYEVKECSGNADAEAPGIPSLSVGETVTNA